MSTKIDWAAVAASVKWYGGGEDRSWVLPQAFYAELKGIGTQNAILSIKDENGQWVIEPTDRWQRVGKTEITDGLSVISVVPKEAQSVLANGGQYTWPNQWVLEVTPK